MKQEIEHLKQRNTFFQLSAKISKCFLLVARCSITTTAAETAETKISCMKQMEMQSNAGKIETVHIHHLPESKKTKETRNHQKKRYFD